MVELRFIPRVPVGAVAGFFVAAVVTNAIAYAAPNAPMMEPTGRSVPALSLAVEPGLLCPDQVTLERQLSAVVPLRAHATASDDAALWSLSVARGDQGVGMVMRDPGGATVMARTVAVFPTRCDIAAQAIAIIVERYFRDLVTAADAPPAPVVSQPVEAALAPGTVDAQATVRPAPSPSASLSLLPRWTAGLGPAYWTRLDVPSAALDVRVRLGRLMVLGVGTLLPWFTSDQTLTTTSPSHARLVGLPVIAQVGAGARRGRWGASLGMQGLVTIEKGHTEGIATTAAAWRTVLATGAVLGAAFDLGQRWRIAVDASLCRAVLGHSYQVAGISDAVLEPPTWQTVVAARLEWAIFP